MTESLLAAIRGDALPLQSLPDLDPLLEQIGDARYVLIGEASHGTHEYYVWRAALSKRLIEEKGFSFIGVEGDWPDCYRVNESVTHVPGAAKDPQEALRKFERWPAWMWANAEVADFTEWLRTFNASLPENKRVGFYGLDLYSLWDSVRAVLDYLQEHQPQYVETAVEALRCFQPYAEDPHSYAMPTGLIPAECEAEVLELLSKVFSLEPPRTDESRNARFNAEQNALSARGAEAYYRAMVRGGHESWNTRDRHMVATLDRLTDFHGPEAKAIVWEHNTHIGDARWTNMAPANMVNVGQLMREAHRDDGVVAVGFGGYQGRVVASDRWGGPSQSLEVPPAREGSIEALLHEALAGTPSALFVFGDQPPAWSTDFRDHRAIGVVYQAETESWGNYVPTILGRRYDAFIWFDQTTALTPLHGTQVPASTLTSG